MIWLIENLFRDYYRLTAYGWKLRSIGFCLLPYYTVTLADGIISPPLGFPFRTIFQKLFSKMLSSISIANSKERMLGGPRLSLHVVEDFLIIPSFKSRGMELSHKVQTHLAG